MNEPHEPGRTYRNSESFTLEGPPLVWKSDDELGWAVDEQAAEAEGWRRGEHGWIKDVSGSMGWRTRRLERSEFGGDSASSSAGSSKTQCDTHHGSAAAPLPKLSKT